MATVKAFVRISTKKKDSTNIRFRLSAGRGMQLFHVSELTVNPTIWDNTRQEIKPKSLCTTEKRNEIITGVAARKSLILKIYDEAPDKDNLTSEWLENEIERQLNPANIEPLPVEFFEILDEYIEKKRFSKLRKRDFRAIRNTLNRYDLYKKATTDTALSINTFNTETLYDIDWFLHNEHKIHKETPHLLASIKYRYPPVERGQNTINIFFGRLRSFFVWAINSEKIENDPFKKFVIEESVYGTPIYISIDEREKLYRTNLSRHPKLAIQRDIFVFQCLIGCRIGDLYRMTKRNVINGAIEYVARKTKEGRPITVRVPLNTIAQNILDKYPDCKKLLPFVSEKKYNSSIKRAFLAARLCRPVTIINPTTREPEIKPLNETASSHMARRCFVGNLYKQVKDPNLVGVLSGHKEGSKAFARYRDIDEEMKIDLVKLLEK